MSTPSTGYRGSQVIGSNGFTENILTADAMYSDYLHVMGGDVAATLAWIKDLGINPPGMPGFSTGYPMNTTQSVLQDPALAPSQPNIYGTQVVNFIPIYGGQIVISATNEVTTGIQPTIMLCQITSPKCIMMVKSTGVGGSVQVGLNYYNTYSQFRIYAGGLIVGKSKVTWYSVTSSPVLGVPTITNTLGVITLTPPLSINNQPLSNVRMEWRKKSAGWVWQPYIGPFQKPSGSYTLQARALKYGTNDLNATAEIIIA